MRSGGRVVEGARLESEYTAKPYRGFESLPLRHIPLLSFSFPYGSGNCPLLCPLCAWLSANECELHLPLSFRCDPLFATFAIMHMSKAVGGARKFCVPARLPAHDPFSALSSDRTAHLWSGRSCSRYLRPKNRHLPRRPRDSGLVPDLVQDDGRVTLKVPHGDRDGSHYSVRARGFRAPSFASAEPRNANEGERLQYRAVAHASEGGQPHDVTGYSDEQLINDLLNRYARFCHTRRVSELVVLALRKHALDAVEPRSTAKLMRGSSIAGASAW
jgi:hypothetical protein